VEVGDDGVVSLAGASLVTTTARVLRLDRALSKQLSVWTPCGAAHDTGVDALAGDVDTAVAAIRSARTQARAPRLKWAPLPGAGAVPVDIDATILIAHFTQSAPG